MNNPTRARGHEWQFVEGMFCLTVAGRKSGVPRSVVLMLVHDGDDLLVCGSFGGNHTAPNRWHNLVAAKGSHVQVGSAVLGKTG